MSEELTFFKNEKKDIEEIFNVLKKYNINSTENLVQLKARKNGLLYAGDYPWVSEIAQIINTFYCDADRCISDITGKVFLVETMETENHQNLLKYSCVFPNRMIIGAGKFVYLDDPKQSFIDIDLLKKLFWSKALLTTGIVHISPFARYTELEPGKGDLEKALVETLNLSSYNKEKIAEFDKCGIASPSTPPVDKNCLFLAIPWLSNTRLEDYQEIIQNNKNEFANYNLKITRLFQQYDDMEELLREIDYELRETNVNISIALEKKQAALRRKGIVTTLAFTLSMVPLTLPAIGPVDPATLSVVLGAPGIPSLFSLGAEYLSIKDIGRENPFWVLWKWKNTSYNS